MKCGAANAYLSLSAAYRLFGSLILPTKGLQGLALRIASHITDARFAVSSSILGCSIDTRFDWSPDEGHIELSYYCNMKDPH